LFALLALLLASLLLLAAALLLTFLALLGSASSEAADEPLGLIGNPSDGVLHPLDGLPGLVRDLACGILRSSALLLTFLALLLLLRLAGLGGARLLYGLFSHCGGRDLQVEEAAIWADLQLDEGSRLILDGARRLPLLVRGPLSALGPRQVRNVAYYLLVYWVALLVDGFLDDVALFVDGALDGLALFVGGGLAEQLGAGGDVLGYLADLIDRAPGSVLDLPCGLARGVLHSLDDLTSLVGDATERTLPSLLVLVTFAHLLSLRRTNGLSAKRLRSVVSRSLRLGRGVRLASN
jgi:hypothetical protein